MDEMEVPTGWIAMEVPHYGVFSKQWTLMWPPPLHLAVAQVRTPGRERVITVVNAYEWVSDQAWMPNAESLWIYDQSSVSESATPDYPDWAPPELNTEPLLPVAFYVRRGTKALIRGGASNGS